MMFALALAKPLEEKPLVEKRLRRRRMKENEGEG
jgi:hypothetical protein